jgi:NAD(P)-dependent dehydrogenase (short-subunit alcohol dehydrogenase family)
MSPPAETTHGGMRAIEQAFSLSGQTALITGGGGVLAGAMACAYAAAGANVALLDLAGDRAEARAAELRASGCKAHGFAADCFDASCVRDAVAEVAAKLGDITILLNTAGGNAKPATVQPGDSIFGVPADALKRVLDLNLIAGAIVPSQIVGEHMAAHGRPSSIINISSMAASRPLTRVVAYSAAKAAVENFTRWLAVHFAMDLKLPIRVNAIAPGFFLTEQNRFLMTTEAGDLTPRGQTVLAHTPMGRFGEPDDLAGVAVWLASDASRFVTGAVIPIDGGFSAFAGV